MRRFRPIRRRQRDDRLEEAEDMVEAEEFQPFVPVSAERDYYDDESAAEIETEYVSPERRRVRLPRVRLPHVRLHRPRLRGLAVGVDVQWGVLLIVVLLIAGGIFGILLSRGQLRDQVEMWWPVGILVVAGGWMLVALVRRQITPFMGGAAFAGVGLSLLMSTQDVAPVEETLLGVVLVTVGLGIVIRGFLLRQRAPF
jgi:hypothetical protein